MTARASVLVGLLFVAGLLASAGSPQVTSAQEVSYTGPSVDQIQGDLAGQRVVFTKPWGFFKAKDSMTLTDTDDHVSDVKVLDSMPADDTLTIDIAFKFVGMVIGGNKNWLKATGTMTYQVENAEYQFVKFVSTSAGEPE